MALNIPTVSTPFGIALSNAYGWLAGLSLDLFQGTGRATLNIHPTEADWTLQPVAQIAVSLGQTLVPANPSAIPPVAAVTFPALDELLADPEFAAAYTTIGTKIYAAMLAHPLLSGSTVTS